MVPVQRVVRIQRQGLLDVVLGLGMILEVEVNDGEQPVGEAAARPAFEGFEQMLLCLGILAEVDQGLTRRVMGQGAGGVFVEPVARDFEGAVPLTAANQSLEENGMAPGRAVGGRVGVRAHGWRIVG